MGGFADFYGQTNFHPMAITAILLLGFAVLVLPRRLALVPMLIAATTVPMAQRIVVAGADLTLMRLLLIAYVLRLLFRSADRRSFVWNRLDTAVLLWTISGTLIMTIHVGGFSPFLNRLGWSYDILLSYFAVRFLIHDWSDVLNLAKASVYISVPVAGLFLLEWSTRYNMFSVFGGVPTFTTIREGRLRCQGPFAHAILAGTFWSSMLPLIWMLLKENGKNRTLAIIGTVAAITIIVASASSTPLLSAAAAAVGALLFRLRIYRKGIWIGLIVVILLLHFVIMKQPVWHLMARMDILGGSTGWHRFVIFDTFVDNFSKWALTGDANPLGWGVWQMRDITNQYMLEGLRGGLLTLSIFLMALIFAFGNVGRSLEVVTRTDANPAEEWRTWLVGVAVFVHVVTFFGISYFGQMITLLYLQLGLAGAIAGLAQAHQKTASATLKDRKASPILGSALPPLKV